MADLIKTIANSIPNIQSKVQEAVNRAKQQAASSTESTKAGSTETQQVTETPKVTQTAKAWKDSTTGRLEARIPSNTETGGTTTSTNLFGDSDIKSRGLTPKLLNKYEENKEVSSTPIPGSIISAARAGGGGGARGWAEEAVDKTILEQMNDWSSWLTKKTGEIGVDYLNKASDLFLNTDLETVGDTLKKGVIGAENIINDSEYYVAKLADVIETSLGGKGGFTEAFQKSQGRYWDAYAKEHELESAKLYEEDKGAQELTKDVSDFFYNIIGDRDISDMLGNVAGHVSANLKDPKQIAYTVGYMMPALTIGGASGGGFWAHTATWIPSQSANVYKDFATDPELTSQYTDSELFGISTGLGTLLSMVETFGDALGDMPWAKAMSRSIRESFTKSLSKELTKNFSKEITNVIDKNLINDIKKPVTNALKKRFQGSVGEGLEEVAQDTIQTEGARALGSKREGVNLEQLLTTFFTAQGMGLIIQGPGTVLNIKNNSDLKEEYKEFSKTVDKVAPGINEDTKMAFFSAMITSQQNDANLSEKKVKEYEEQTTKLYEERSMLEQRLEQAENDEVRAKINGWIEKTDNKIKDIDKKINQWNNTRDEINKYIEEHNAKVEEEETQKELEELHAEINQSIEGEDLSEQTMEDLGDQTNTPEFNNWFKESKVVDGDGKPLKVYHGTRYDIKTPDMSKIKEGGYGAGMYFTTSKEGASNYASAKKGILSSMRKPRVMETYLSIQNPIKEGEYRWDNKWIDELKDLGYKVNEEYLSREDVDVFSKYFNLLVENDKKNHVKLMEDFSRITGYDGLVATQEGGEDYRVAFKPEQIKSATENVGTFDANNPDIRGSIKVRQLAPGQRWDKKYMRKIFEKSVNDIKSGAYYGDTEFAGYAYYNTSTMTKDTKDVMKMRAKVEDLLRKIGVRIRYTSNPDRDMGHGLSGVYESGIKRVTYANGEAGVQIYGHEVFHAIMDIIHNGKITDKELQTKLREVLDKAINDVKKQFGIDIYKEGTEEFEIANTFAEERLANSFGEYLAKRELEGPKTFVQKIKEFFKQIISLFSKEGLAERSLNKELRDAFESIANGGVIRGRPLYFYRRGFTGERLGGRAGFKLPSTDYDYTSLASALNQPTNTYLQDLSDEDLQKLHDTAFAKWQSLMDNEEYGSPLIKATTSIVGKVNEEIARRERESAEKATKKSEEEKTATKTKIKFKDAKDYINKMIEIDKRNGVWSKSNDKFLRKTYMSNFLRTNLEGDFSAHLPGLKNVNLKQIKGKLTDKDIRDIAEMLSLVSTTLGIDFNKVIQDKDMSMNIVYNIKDFLYNTGALGLMSWKATKQMVKDLEERSGERFNVNFGADLAKMGVALTLEQGPMKSAATMAHELMHLIDFALSTEEGLPLYFEKGKVTYTSIIKDDSSWKTYTKGNYDKDYYNRWQEIIARYAEQYFAYKNDKDLFDKFTKRQWYWTEEEFLKLLPKFESFIKNRLGAKLLDEQNQFYNDIVRRINENKFSTISTEFDKEGLREDEVKYKLEQLKEEYVWIMEHINEMTGTLKEEMEAYVQLSNLQSNYEMAKAKGEEYLEKLKTTPEKQDAIDETTTTAVPEPPQDTGTIKLGLPYFGGSNIEEGTNDIAEGGKGEKLGESYMSEETTIKIRQKKNKIKTFKKELGQTVKDIFTPTISRIYNISPRVAGRLITMETQKDINIYRYRQKAKGFVETLGKLKGNNALEVKMALLDYGALASEQGENIEEYKKEEAAKLREVLIRSGFKEKDINDMFDVLNDIGKQYQDAGLKLTVTDMYFPRVVKDYEGLIDYMNRVSGKDIKVNKVSLMLKIKNIQSDPDLTDEEKEAKIRRAISIEFNQPGTTSEHAKERKMGKLSDWGEGIFAYYESPIEALDHYIVTMTNAIQRQLFLGGMKEDADITESDILNQNTAESVSTIIGKLVEQGKINEDDVEELQKSILAVLNKKRSPKSVTALKDITYIATITNFLSAINQLDDLGMVILKDKSGLKHIVKTIFGKAGIKYDELGLEDAYEMFREEGGVTNWLFKKSFFNFFDRLGKTSFVNAAWESMVRQSKNEKTRNYLYTRLVSMYGQESADRMMEKIDSGNYMGEDGQIDIEILRDLLYQLGSTQPIYTSAMSTTYLNHPWARLCYALSSFTIKRIDWLVQGTKEVNAKHGKVAAGAWLMGVSVFLAMFGAAIGDIGDFLKGKKEETFLWNLINKGIDEALAAGGSDMIDSWLKIWDLSEYDIKTYKSQGLWGVFSSKIKPFIFDLGKDVVEAIWEHDLDEITDLAKYVPIFGKLTYYWLWDNIKEDTKSEKSKDDIEWDFGDEDVKWDFGDEDVEWDFGEDNIEWDFS